MKKNQNKKRNGWKINNGPVSSLSPVPVRRPPTITARTETRSGAVQPETEGETTAPGEAGSRKGIGGAGEREDKKVVPAHVLQALYMLKSRYWIG